MGTFIAKAETRVRVTIQCEGCDQPFEFDSLQQAEVSRGLSGNDSYAVAEKIAATQAENVLRLQIDRILKGRKQEITTPRTCPHCGYLQSFMIARWYEETQSEARNWFMVFTALVIFMACGISFQERTIVPVLAGAGILVVGGVVVGQITQSKRIHPNREWLAKRGKTVDQAPAGRGPTAVVASPEITTRVRFESSGDDAD